MNKKVKALLLVLCALVFAVAGVFATLAYLNDTTEQVTNTITVGDVDIDLDEYKVSYDEYYNETVHTELARVKANDYNLIPGVIYTKDPTVHVKADSEPSYIFVRVVNEIAGIEANVADDGVDTIAKQMADNGWVAVDGKANLYVYNGTKCDIVNEVKKDNVVNAKKGGAIVDLVVFENFRVNPDADNGGSPDIDDFNNKTIKIKAYAVQAIGLTVSEAANMADAALIIE